MNFALHIFQNIVFKTDSTTPIPAFQKIKPRLRLQQQPIKLCTLQAKQCGYA